MQRIPTTRLAFPQRLFEAVQWLLPLLLIALLAGSASACPTCKIALESQDEAAARLMNGYFWSIIFMMSMPFVVLGSFGSYLYFQVRKAQAEQLARSNTPATA